MTRFSYAAALAVLAIGLLYYFAALATFNVIVPKDGGSEPSAVGVAYGPDPRHGLDIYSPTGSATGLPVLVFLYGGSWNSGDRASYGFAGRAFAARGFLTMIADYRLVPNHPYPDFVADAARAIAWASQNAERFGGDGGKLFIVGHSAGGYNAAQAVLAPQFLEQAGVRLEDIRAVATLAAPLDFLPLDTASSLAAFGNVADLPATQPVNHVRRDAPPMLLLTGSDDQTVLPRNSRELARRLEAVGATVSFKEYAGVGHVGILLAIARPLRGWAPVVDDIASFFQKYD